MVAPIDNGQISGQAKSHPRKHNEGVGDNVLAIVCRPFGKVICWCCAPTGCPTSEPAAKAPKKTPKRPVQAGGPRNQRGGQDNITILILADTQ